jgi:regulator of protease activity HflC (stomatin/prohibitin superfamily)
MHKEIVRDVPSGLSTLAILIVATLVDIGLIVLAAVSEFIPLVVIGALLLPVLIVCWTGLFTVAPNEGRVLQLFGNYIGTVRSPGLKWANPFYSKRHISLRVRNFESAKLKVNDHDGSPIEIAAVVVWKVVDTAEAAFEVDSYENYVHVQSETALRNLASQYAYDAHEDGKLSLRGNTQAVADQLQTEVQTRLAKAGVEVVEARISHLAYAPEIAASMLRRQQATAVIAARSQIVAGAVGMVEMALTDLEKRGFVKLDDERKAQMVSNLLVVLCGERDPQPVVNTGTIYS